MNIISNVCENFEQGEIKATGFNEAVDNLYQLFEEGKVYYITKARVNIAKKQFSNLTNDYEIMFENQSEVTLVSRSMLPSRILLTLLPCASFPVRRSRWGASSQVQFCQSRGSRGC